MTIDANKYSQLAVEGRGTNGKKHPAQKPIPRRTRTVSRSLFDAEQTKAFQVAWSTAPSKIASIISADKAFSFQVSPNDSPITSHSVTEERLQPAELKDRSPHILFLCAPFFLKSKIRWLQRHTIIGPVILQS